MNRASPEVPGLLLETHSGSMLLAAAVCLFILFLFPNG